MRGQGGTASTPDLEALRQGDESAWHGFFEAYDPLIRSVTSWSRWHLDHHARQDVAQSIRAELLKAIQRYDGRSSLEYFVKKVCIHRCIDEVRRQVRNRETPASLLAGEDDPPWDPPDTREMSGFDPFREVCMAERAAILKEMLARIDQTCVTAIRCFYLEQLSYRQIAEKLAIAVNTVGSRLSKCLEKLRREAAACSGREWPVASTEQGGNT